MVAFLVAGCGVRVASCKLRGAGYWVRVVGCNFLIRVK
jgi:hypothetical protein